MKKIKTIKELQAERRKVTLYQRELENEMYKNWNELKGSFNLLSVAKDTFSKVLKFKTAEKLDGESVLKNTVAFGFSLLAAKVAKKTGEKLSGMFKKKHSAI
jgi:hypothetical protein